MSDCNNNNSQENIQEQDQLILQEDCSHQNPTIIPNFQTPHQPPMHHQETTDPFLGGGGRLFPPHQHHEVLPWQLPPTPFSPVHHFPTNHHDPFMFPPPLPSSSSSAAYANLFGRRPHHLQFAGYDVGPSSSSGDPLRILSEALGQPGGAPFGLQMQAELNRMTAQEIMDAKALAASKSHSEGGARGLTTT